MLYNSVKYKNDEPNKFVYGNTCDITNECIHTDDHYTSQSVINKHTHAITVEHVQQGWGQVQYSYVAINIPFIKSKHTYPTVSLCISNLILYPNG